MELVIHIELRNTSGAMEVMNQTFELPDAQSDPINEGEEAILEAFTTAQMLAYQRYLASVAREAAEVAQAAYGGTVVENTTPYRVDGEIGRITFPTYAVQQSKQILWNSVPKVFGAQGPREFYATRSAKKLLLDFASLSSYRTTARIFNRVRRSSRQNRTPVTTIASFVHREGIAVQAYLGHFVTSTLAQHQFTPDGVPQSESNPVYQRPLAEAKYTAGRLFRDRVTQARLEYNADQALDRQIPASAMDAVYEDLHGAVNISLDDVGVKKQKAQRSILDSEEAEASPPTEVGVPSGAARAASILGPEDPTLKRVHNTIAHIETPEGHYILHGLGTVTVLQFVIAFLLHKDLLREHAVQFFVDGARSLHADILAGMRWFRPKRIFLDWFHLHEKCKVELSLVLRGKDVRNPVLAELMPLLWLGQIDAAIAYLRAIRPAQIKSGKSVDRLIEYFERNREHIPCYALRAQLGLRNSSNRGEKANDLCVAARQKDNGMSWSRDGSVALASTTTLQRNDELDEWCRSRSLSFNWVLTHFLSLRFYGFGYTQLLIGC